MTLEAIIIRADGAFAETDELRRQAFIATFDEAGFTWDIDREVFARSAGQGSLIERLSFLVRQYLKRPADSPDVDELVAAMHRRACKLFSSRLESGSVPPRPGIRELIVAARQDGLRLALVAGLRSSEAMTLIVQAVGERGAEAFDIIEAKSDCETPLAVEDLYRQVLKEISVAPVNCLVIEATLQGTNAAKAVGLPVIMTRSSYCLDDLSECDTSCVFEDLPGVLGRSGKRPLEPLSRDQGSGILAALQWLHSGKSNANLDINGSDAMRVSDILKTKGSEVKTIEATATMRALAQALRVETVGAMVVKDAKGALQGIISERDLARGLAEFGNDLPSMPVSALMTKSVITCSPDDSVAAVANVMTHRRIRHLPVVINGVLAGVVSIGDVLKHRLDEVQLEANVLRDYAMARK